MMGRGSCSSLFRTFQMPWHFLELTHMNQSLGSGCRSVTVKQHWRLSGVTTFTQHHCIVSIFSWLEVPQETPKRSSLQVSPSLSPCGYPLRVPIKHFPLSPLPPSWSAIVLPLRGLRQMFPPQVTPNCSPGDFLYMSTHKVSQDILPLLCPPPPPRIFHTNIQACASTKLLLKMLFFIELLFKFSPTI